jgi:hypothetical protein
VRDINLNCREIHLAKIFLLVALALWWQAPLCEATNTSPAEVAAPEPRVIEVFPKTNQLGHTVTLRITNLPNLLSNAHALQKPIVLFVEGKELNDVAPISLDQGSNTLSFQLQRTTRNKDVWTPLLRYPMSEPIRPLKFSAGLLGTSPLLVGDPARDTWLWVIGWNGWTVAWLVVFVLLLLIFLVLAVSSDVLRSPELDSAGRHPYSLSRTQAAFWLFVTSMSFVFIWMVTGDLATLNASILALIGISSGTYLASTLLETPGATTSPAPAAAATPASNLQKALNTIQSFPFIGRFLGDILADRDGISVHRFQIFVWTIVLGIIFIVSVCNELSMPEFNATLLALMGISSATYVGAKLTQ